MITRLMVAAVGAIIVTAGLLLAMDAVTSLFRSQSGERYFRITDILPKLPPGRPERPGALRPPERVEPELTPAEPSLPIEVPAGIDREAPPLESPALEPPEPRERP
ncbi:MAG TPA: hypothetical protein VMR74_01845 [Gammaproteobacteria bacterium]|nr:hypothetical protein [Gammaproteobacteria bacterium]